MSLELGTLCSPQDWTPTLFEKVNFEKKSADNNKFMKNYPAKS